MKFFFLFLLVLISNAFAKPCGISGSIEERIKDCSQTKGNFVVVAITEKGIEIYKDIKSGLIWGNRISSDFNHYGSQKACAEANVDHEVLGMKWRLPTINEFENASSHGMKSALPNMNYWFWSSTPVKVKKKYRRRRGPPAQVFLWDGSEEKTDVGDLKDGASVRCVTKE